MGTVEGEIVRELKLPSGGTVILRDPHTLRYRDKQRILRAVNEDAGRLGFILDVRDGVACMLVEAWTIPGEPNLPLPSESPEFLGRLSIPDGDALADAVAPAVKMLFPDPVTPDDSDKPGSPTLPAGDSKQG